MLKGRANVGSDTGGERTRGRGAGGNWTRWDAG